MRTLPDHLRKGMRLVIVGCNPSESSVRVGHYYAGRGNEFWPILYESGVVPEPFDYHDDKRVIEFGVGLTDLEQFAQRSCKFGIQKELLYGARVYVLPSTSGANATGKQEKLRHFKKLAQLVERVGKEYDSRSH